MANIELSAGELTLLKDYVKTTPLILIRYKCQAILLRSKRMKLLDISDIVSRDEETVGLWIRDFSKRRMASIFTGHQHNENASKLTKQQKEEIRGVLQKPPSEQGLPMRFWDVPTLKTYTQTTFGAVYESERSYHFLLTFGQLSFKYPSTFDRRRNEDVIAQSMAEIHKEIAPMMENDSWEVFTSDEVRIELEAITRRAWLKKGEPTVVKVDRKREAQNYIGFLNQKSFTCHLFDLEWQDQDEILKTFEHFLKEHPNKNICVIWDNAAFHKGKKIRDSLRKGGLLERVHLIALPPYAPDMNPIEHVWKESKGQIANVQRENLEATKYAFRGYIEGRKFHFQIPDFVLR